MSYTTFTADVDAARETNHPATLHERVLTNKLDKLQKGVVDLGAISHLVAFTLNVTTGSVSEDIFDAAAPFAFEIVDVIIQPRGTSTNGTMKITNGTNDITDAMVVAVDKTMVRPATIDDAYSTIAVGGTLEIVGAGDSVAATIGLVTVIVKPT